MKIKHILIIIGLLAGTQLQAQTIDRITAVVGNHIILQSEIEAQYEQSKLQAANMKMSNPSKCSIFENLMLQKMLLHQSEIDSVNVSESQVEATLNQRMRYFVSQLGSEEKLEQYYDKSIQEIKDELRTPIREQLKIEAMRENLTSGVQITPAEVKTFFESIPENEKPVVGSKYQIGQIVIIPNLGKAEMEEAKNKLKDIRNRIMNGEDFGTLAVLYSEDNGSAKQKGDLGTFGRGEMQPEFEAAAFALKRNEVSEIFKTTYGYHIVKLLERKGNYVHAAHILIKPKISDIELNKAILLLDSIKNQIQLNTINFHDAAQKFSQDPGKQNGAYVINPINNTTYFTKEEMNPQTFFVVNKLKIGEISDALPHLTSDNEQAYRLLYLISKSDEHIANLKEDYSEIQRYAEEKKKMEVLNDWVYKTKKKIYIKINEPYNDCKTFYKW